LQFYSQLEPLHDARAFAAYLAPAAQAEWVVYAKPPFGGAHHVLDYLARYTHRVAISNNRLLSFSDGRVTFLWKDYQHAAAKKTMTLAADEFIRRFLLRAPDGFQPFAITAFWPTVTGDQTHRCRQLRLPSRSSSQPRRRRTIATNTRSSPANRYATARAAAADTCWWSTPSPSRSRTHDHRTLRDVPPLSFSIPAIVPCVSDGPGSSACHLRRKFPRVLQRPAPQTGRKPQPRPFIRRDAACIANAPRTDPHPPAALDSIPIAPRPVRRLSTRDF
jgi:hypothetical protein